MPSQYYLHTSMHLSVNTNIENKLCIISPSYLVLMQILSFQFLLLRIQKRIKDTRIIPAIHKDNEIVSTFPKDFTWEGFLPGFLRGKKGLVGMSCLTLVVRDTRKLPSSHAMINAGVA